LRVSPECAPCLLNRAVSALELSGADDETKMAATMKALSNLRAGFKPTAVPAVLEVKDMEMIKRLTGNSDPYRQLKLNATLTAKEISAKIPQARSAPDQEFKRLALMATAANGMEFDVRGYSFDANDLIKPSPFEIDQTDQFWQAVNSGRSVTYIMDNAGEHVFDAILVNFLAKYTKVTVLVKTIPLLNDVILQDLEGMRWHENVRLLGFTPRAIGALPEDLPEGTKLVLAKGMANFETLTEEHPGIDVYHALKVKCLPVSRAVGARLLSNVFVTS